VPRRELRGREREEIRTAPWMDKNAVGGPKGEIQRFAGKRRRGGETLGKNDTPYTPSSKEGKDIVRGEGKGRKDRPIKPGKEGAGIQQRNEKCKEPRERKKRGTRKTCRY